VANVFMVVEPLLGWQAAQVTAWRADWDFAEVLWWLGSWHCGLPIGWSWI
jgi:hypothetical protein